MNNQSGDGATGSASVLARAVPALFVVLWASGFIVARLVRPYADPETFVALRFALTVLILVGVAIVSRAPWPRTIREWGAVLLAGALMQGAFVGGVFWSVKHGLPAAVASLIAGLQPLMTGALAGPLLAERVSPRRWLGILIGFVGAVLVLLPHIEGAEAVPKVAILGCFGATIAITLGTIWQKRIGGAIDVRTGLAIQFMGGFLVTLPFAVATEPMRLDNHRDLWIGLGWGTIGLSVITGLLLLRLIKQGAVARVTALFYLTPPVTALMALVLFGESLVLIQIVGMGVAAIGVAIANRG